MIEDQCPVCGYDIEVVLDSGPTACPGCSFEIDPKDLNETLKRLQDLLHKTMPSTSGQGIREWKRQIRLKNMGTLVLKRGAYLKKKGENS